MEQTVQTAYGEMTIAELVRYTELWKAMTTKHNEFRRRYNQTDAGKEKNREKAKQYYERNKEKVLEKRKQRYREKKTDEYLMTE